jgi:hypothetical protein
MTVDVASSVGLGAVVQGDSVTGQGGYFVPQTAANVNVDIAASDATNPRNDLVVLEVKDDQHDASGLNLARVRVITGTANASAVGTDAPGANGTPALPSSCLLLAVVRVTAAASSVTTAMINDRRPWAGGVPSYETSLPSPAADGQEIYYRADSTNGVIWHLRFRNVFNGGSATYPWEFIGGSPLTSAVATSENTASTTYVDLSTSGPSVTAPLAGDYILQFGAEMLNNGANINLMSVSIGGAAASDTESSESGASAANKVLYGFRETYRTGVSASTAFTAKYRTTAGTASFRRRQMKLLPVRVG